MADPCAGAAVELVKRRGGQYIPVMHGSSGGEQVYGRIQEDGFDSSYWRHG